MLSMGGGAFVELYAAGAIRLSLDLGVRYLLGGQANHLTEGAIARDSGFVRLNTTQSRTDVTTIDFGVVFEF